MATGRLVTIEGLDGAGKSTLAVALAAELSREGLAIELLREPGGVLVSERIRELLQDPALAVSSRAEALLYAAARAQLVHERLLPLLERGAFVLLDRFVDSSLAYQGAGRDLGVEQVRLLNSFALGGLTPDRTLLLRIDPERGQARIGARGEQLTRMEREGLRFFAKVSAAYDALAVAEPQRVRSIDAERAPDQVLADALAELSDIRPTA